MNDKFGEFLPPRPDREKKIRRGENVGDLSLASFRIFFFLLSSSFSRTTTKHIEWKEVAEGGEQTLCCRAGHIRGYF